MVVTQLKAISKFTSGQMAQIFRENAARLKSRVAERAVDDIIDFSPVDTGTYIMAHVAGTDESAQEPDRSSQGKERGRNPAQFRNLARGNLKRSVSSTAVMNATEIWFRNRALHAERVESLGWPAPLFGNSKISGPRSYRVYAKTRRRMPEHIRAAARELGFATR